jgi:hypothetical protein
MATINLVPFFDALEDNSDSELLKYDRLMVGTIEIGPSLGENAPAAGGQTLVGEARVWLSTTARSAPEEHPATLGPIAVAGRGPPGVAVARGAHTR